MDRHLFVLRQLAEQRLAEGGLDTMPTLFDDESWHTMQKIIVSTSTLPGRWFMSGGFGPVNPDCYAIGYGARPEGAGLQVMSHFKGSQEFVDHAAAAFYAIRDTIEAEATTGGRAP